MLLSVTDYYAAKHFFLKLFNKLACDITFQAKFHPFSGIQCSAIYRLGLIPDVYIHWVSKFGMRIRSWILSEDRQKISFLSSRQQHTIPTLHSFGSAWIFDMLSGPKFIEIHYQINFHNRILRLDFFYQNTSWQLWQRKLKKKWI